MPCTEQVDAVEPDEETRDALVNVCGESWSEGKVCCTKDQIGNLKKSLKKAETIIASCPACKENFFQFFCTFTCSPDQSLFVNVTEVQKSTSDKDIVKELNHYVAPDFAEGFYNSCKEVKFSATNGYAMDFIGGGAKDYKAFLKFLGDEKPLLGGSPFQMNFPWDKTPDPIVRSNITVRDCSDPDYRCACSDCPSSCPELPAVENKHEHCKVGLLPCFSFGVLMVYASVFVLLSGGYAITYLLKKRSARSIESRRLLYDDDSDDENENDDYFGGNASLGRLFHTFRSSNRLRGPYGLNTKLEVFFGKLAYFCARFPAVVISLSLVIVGLLSLGWLNLGIETSPVRLWVSPYSKEYAEKQFYDENFGPFYRAQQAYLVNDTGPVLSYDTLKWWFDVEERVYKLRSLYDDGLSDLCFKPLGDDCIVQSVTQYFHGDINQLPEAQWDKKIAYCANNPIDCLPPFQRPLDAASIFGGYEESGNVLQSNALVVSWVNLNDEEGTEFEKRSIAWEEEMEKLMLQVAREAESRGLRLSFNTEMSLEKELNKSSNTDAKIIVISYIAMFLYASVSLGGVIPGVGRVSLVKSKFSLGLFGIFVVLLSVVASVGLFAALGVKVTLIIAEVIPFLVLAVGVDNIFLLTHELDNVNLSHPSESVEKRVARAVGHIGPSILLSATCETIAFALGSTVGMPAVRNFAMYSAGAVLFNSILQLTMFVSALTLDQKRVESNRLDCLPFIKLNKSKLNRESFSTMTARVLGSPGVFEKFDEPSFSKLMRKYYAPYLLKRKVKVIVTGVFFAWFAASLALLPNIELGLDQRLAVPEDSYLVDYFNDLYAYFNQGPPVFFITKDTNVTSRDQQQALCGRFSTCQEYSLVNVIEQERKRPEVSYIDAPAASWIDDFFQWLNPSLDQCCRFKKGTNETEFCSPFASDRQCDVCYANRDWEPDMTGLPEGKEFLKFFQNWIEAPSDPCPLGGKAAYGSSVIADYDQVSIPASLFRSSHVPMKSQDDFINGYASARRIADMITKFSGIETFPYSNFYIFFAQYSTIVKDTFGLIGSALAIMAVISTILLGSLRTALVLTGTVLMIVCDIAGVMSLWGVSLNAVSLVNLVICVGIAVEFCAHIARAFTFTQKVSVSGLIGVSRDTRSFNALVGVGGSVFGGIALTKLIGVIVLAFTRSKIFEVYYFRMWLALVLISTLHSFVFLPVALTYLGGSGYIIDQGDQGVAGDLASRLYESNPDLSDDEDER